MKIRNRAQYVKGWSTPAITTFMAGLATLLMAASILTGSVANAAPPATIVHPEYTKPIIDPAAQPHWVTGIPNALADYFTFKPYASDTAAVAAGFPSGVCGTGPNQEDCYSVSVRQFQQQLGLVDGSGALLSTTVWGYGSSTNAPAVGPFTAGVWHFPAPTFAIRSNRPARITWANELPNIMPAGFDPSYDCGPNAPNCFPYNRITTHVHGAHVADDSDGLTTAWYTPIDPATGKPSAVGPDYEPSKYGPPGTYRYENSQEASTIWYHDHAMGTTHTNTNQGMAGFFPITDANEDALRGITNPAAKVLPTGAYEVGFALQDRNFWPDGSLAMPDTPIYNKLADATCTPDPTTNVISAACPAVPFSKDATAALIPYNATITDPLLRGPFTATGRVFAACTPDPINGGVITDTCPEVPFSKAPAPDSNLIPYNAAITDPLLRGPFTAASGTLEYFGNVPVVNGVAFGTYDVEPRVYRMRFIGGTDSRTLILQLQERGTGTVIPFWQIGSEQGFLNNPVLRNMITLMPGERVDVLVDFSALTTANTKVVLANLGPDMPYGGVYVPADRSVDMPEIMEFNSLGTAGLSAVPEVTIKPVVPAAPLNVDGYADTTIALRPAAAVIAPNNLTPTVGTPVRNVSLIEITDQFGRTMPTIDSRGFMPAMVPITEVIKIGDTEQWDIINTTVDSHPMHLHQTAFQLIDRQDLPATTDPITGLATGFVPPVTDIMTGTFSQPTYAVAAGSVPIPPAAWEQGWKDTIECPPGKVTRVKAKFDIPGVYVWHCHILSHEEHDMMRPMVVTTPLTPASVVTLASSAPGNTQPATTAAPVTFTAAAQTGIAAYPESMGFEYQFTVTPPAGVTVTQPTMPASRTTMIAGSTPGYTMIREAVWTPPTVPGDYVVTVKAKAIGAADLPANIGTGTLTYTVAPPAVSAATTTAVAGTYGVGAVIPITVNFNQPVTTTGLTLTLNNGATVTTGALNNAASFTGNYTVAAGHNTPVGQYLTIAAITGTITDAAGNLTTAPLISAGSNLATALLATVDPTVASITITNPALVNTAATAITGTATAPALAVVQTVTVSVNNGPPIAATITAGGTFNAPVTLAAGVNTISITAADNAVPPRASTVLSSITLNTVATAITVATPALVNTAATTITGVAVPPPANTVTAVTVSVNNTAPVAAVIGANGAFSAPVTLNAGLNTITVTATDNAVPPTVSTQVSGITLDSTASIITATTPAVVNTATTTITGIITPPVGTVITSVMVSVNNGPAVAATVGIGGSYLYSAPVTLANGTNIIKAVATDNAIPAKVTTFNSTVVFDATAAMIAVTSPALVNTPATTITGIVTSGPNPVQTVNVSVNGAIVPATLGAGGVFSAPVVLTAGANTVTITATDNAAIAKVSTTVSTITLNTAATMIAITTPAIVNTAATTITGTATPPALGTVQSVTVSLNGTPVTTTVGAGGAFTTATPVTLAAGNNVLTIVATDAALKQSVVVRNITFDPTATMIAVTTPALVNTAATTITGTATPPPLGTVQAVTVTLNGTPVTTTVGAGGIFTTASPVTLAAGNNVLTIVATDAALKQSIAVRNITFDPAATIITITTPALVNTAATTITGTATPPTLGTVQTVTVTLNGTPVTTTVGAGGVFTTTVPVTLTAGNNLITVTATDAALKQSIAVQNITFDPAATIIAVTTPSLVNTATTTITGTATPPALGTVQTVTVTLNGTPVTATVGAGGVFTTTGPVTLITGNNVLTIVATDATLKQSVVVRNIIFDPTATMIAVTTPPLVNTTTTTITGTVTPPPLGTVQTVTVTINGTTVTTTVGAGGVFTTTTPVTLTTGNNVITITATDATLKQSTVVQNITFDPTATMIAVTIPPIVNPATTTVTGTVTPGTNGIGSVTVNGTPVIPGPAGDFTAPVTLTPGSNVITIIVTDTTGKQTKLEYSATLDTTLPVVTVTSPAAAVVNTANITFNCTATDPVGIKSVTVNGITATRNSNDTYSANLVLGAASNTITTVATDQAGNQTTVIRTVTLDNVVPVTTPSQVPGTYTGPLTVALSSEPGATIYYTTNGALPTVNSPVYSGPIVLSSATTATFTIRFFAVDQAGNIETVKSAAYTIHVSDLVGSFEINRSALFTKSRNVMLDLTASDPFGVPQMQVACDGVTFAAAEPFAVIRYCTLSAGDGLKSVAVKFIDGTGTVYAPSSKNITLDTTAPVTTASPAGGTYEGSLNVTFSTSEPATIYYTTNGSIPPANASVYTGPIALSSLTTKTITLKFFAFDQAGNLEAVKSEVYNLHVGDLTGNISINNGSPYTASQSVQLNLTAADPVGVSSMQFSNDGVTYSTAEPFAAARTWTLLPGDGVKTVYVKYTDSLGFVYAPYTAQITLDTVAPSSTVHPPSGTFSGSVTFTLGSNEPGAIHYTTDNTPPTLNSPLYTGPVNLASATTTAFKIRYFAVDQAGNAEAAKTVDYSIHVNDLTGSVSINTGSQQTNSTTVTLSLAATDPNGVPQMQVACDGITFGTVESFVANRTCILSSGDGVKNVAVKYIDGFGTVYPPVSAQITLDTVAPVTVATPAPGTYSGTVTTALNANENGVTYYTTDGTTPTTSSPVYSGPITLTSSTTQTITVQYFTVDLAGNPEPSRSTAYTIHVGDLTGSITINNGATHTKDAAVILTLSATDPAGVSKMQFSNDGASFSALETYATSKNWSLIPGEGQKTVYVRFVDALGTLYDPFIAQINLDTTQPVTTASPLTGVYNGNVTVTFATNEPATIYYTTDGSTPTTSSSTYSSPVFLSPAASQTFDIRYFAVDLAGNAETVKSIGYTVHLSDLTGSVKINNGATYTSSRNVTLTLSASDPSGVTGMQIACDGVNFDAVEPFATTRACTLPAGDGAKDVAVKFIDGIGTVYDPSMAQIILDTAVLVTTATPNTGNYTGTVTVTLSSSKPGAVIHYTTDGSPCTTASPVYTGPFYLTASATTTFNVQYLAVDAAGNIETVRNSTYTIHVSDLSSSVKINNGAAFSKSRTVTLALIANDPAGIPSMLVSCDGTNYGLVESFSSTRTCTLTSGDGIKVVAVKFIDSLGTEYPPTTAEIRLDTAAPVTTASPASGSYSGTVTVALTNSEPGSTIYVTTDGQPATSASPVYSGPITLTAAATTTYKVQFFSMDQAGNAEAARSIDYTLHRDDLTGSVRINNGSQRTNSTTVALTLAATDPSGVPKMQVACDGTNYGSEEAFAATRSCILPNGDGVKNVAVRFIDGLGTVYPPVTAEIVLDTITPVTTASPAAGIYTGAVTVNLAGSKPGVTIYYTTDGQPVTAASPVYSGPITLASDTTTTYRMQFFAKDQAGNIETVNSIDYTLHVDDLSASILINNGAQLTNSATVTLTLAATDPSGVSGMQVACDGMTFNAVEPFKSTRSCILTPNDGMKNVAVRFIDGLGTEYPPVTAQITLDTAVPATTPSPGAGNYEGSVKVVLASDKPATIHYTTDGSTPTLLSPKYTSPVLLSSSTTAEFTLKYFAVDAAGNTEAVKAATYSIHQSDLTGAISINSGKTVTNSQSAVLSIQATDPAGVTEMQVACDGANFASIEPYATAKTCVLPAGDGLKTVLIKFKDALGVWYPPVSAQITLDTAVPSTSTTPVGGTYDQTVNVSLSPDENAVIHYTTDGTTPTVNSPVYSAPIVLSSATTQAFNVRYFAVDKAGNAETAKSTTYIIHVSDLTGSITINGGSTYSDKTAVSLTLSANDPQGVSSMQFSNDGVNYSPLEPYATGKTWNMNGGDGLKTVYVRFKDGTGSLYTFTANIILSAELATGIACDLNGDGRIDIADALKALQISVGMFQPTLNELVRGDVAPFAAGKPKPDGVIDTGDALVILKRILGLVYW